MRDKKLKEWLAFIGTRGAFISVIYILSLTWRFLANKEAKELWGVDYDVLVIFEYIDRFVKFLISFF